MFRSVFARCGFAALALVLLMAGCGEPVATPEPTFVRAAGAMAMGPVMAELAAAYHEQSPAVSVEVEALGSRFGLDALRAGRADLAFVAGLPSAEDGLDAGWQSAAVARDGIAIIVHPDNPVGGLGLLQLADLFNGRVHEWDMGEGRPARQVQVVSREEGSGTRVGFEALVMGEQEVTPLAVMVTSGPMVIEYVAAHPEAIGYVSMSEVVPGVKVVEVEGVLPTPESAGRGSYPLGQELWLIWDDSAPEAVPSFVNFVRSPAGQQIVGRYFGRIR
jgi:phosphate transport system substrate-binding protein